MRQVNTKTNIVRKGKSRSCLTFVTAQTSVDRAARATRPSSSWGHVYNFSVDEFGFTVHVIEVFDGGLSPYAHNVNLTGILAQSLLRLYRQHNNLRRHAKPNRKDAGADPGRDEHVMAVFEDVSGSVLWPKARRNDQSPNQRQVDLSDDGVAVLGSLIGNPKEWLLSLGLRVIRLRESNDVAHVIDVLSQT
jgi:hypothetical protein